jgi:hypothetical protein
MDLHELEQSLTSHISGARSAELTTKFGLVERLIEALAGMRGMIAALDKAEVIKLLGDLYDNWIAPLDLPGIPNLVEPQIDKMLRNVLLAIVERIIDRAKENAGE